MAIRMKVSGITGDGTGAKFPGWFDLNTFSWLESTDYSGGTGGAGTGKPNFGDFVVTRSIGLGSNQFMLKAATGTHIDEIIVVVTKAVADAEYILERWTLDTVLMASYQVGGDLATPRPYETLEFHFKTLKFELFTIRDDGSHGDPQVATLTNLGF
ncbi:MAG TPA: type VI secretion system tube protein Hcp [Fimbriimonas sp.]|nr:type VI secretion system tube protein Hcp [Fimbriimonas sp.]